MYGTQIGIVNHLYLPIFSCKKKVRELFQISKEPIILVLSGVLYHESSIAAFFRSYCPALQQYLSLQVAGNGRQSVSRALISPKS
jgi:hypothetical protein